MLKNRGYMVKVTDEYQWQAYEYSIYASGFKRRCVFPGFWDSLNLWPQVFWLLEKGSSAKISLADVFLAVFQILLVFSAVRLPSTFPLGFWSVCLSQGLQKVIEVVFHGMFREEDGPSLGLATSPFLPCSSPRLLLSLIFKAVLIAAFHVLTVVPLLQFSMWLACFLKLGIYKWWQLYVLHWGLLGQLLELLVKLLFLLEIFHQKWLQCILSCFCMWWHIIFIKDRTKLVLDHVPSVNTLWPGGTHGCYNAPTPCAQKERSRAQR